MNEVITEGDGRSMPEHFDPAVLNAFKKLAPAEALNHDPCLGACRALRIEAKNRLVEGRFSIV